MSACWKFSWNVDPAALMVPLAVAAALDAGVLAGDEPLPAGVLVLAAGVVDEEEHAARPSAIATTAPPTVTACCLRRSCISRFSLWFMHSLGRDKQLGCPVSLQTVVCQYSLPTLTQVRGKPEVDSRSLESEVMVYRLANEPLRPSLPNPPCMDYIRRVREPTGRHIWRRPEPIQEAPPCKPSRSLAYLEDSLNWSFICF
jgi:hypothetical protein